MTCTVGMNRQNIHYKPIKSVGMFLIFYLFFHVKKPFILPI